MRVLVLTNQFAAFGGSEIVALEVARWFQSESDDVTLGANYIRAPMSACAEGITLRTDIEGLDLAEFDLVWCHHDLLTLLPAAAFERAARGRLPHVALISLSPYEDYEHVDALLARALSAEVLVNSPETAKEVLRRGRGQVAAARVRAFYNAAPKEFWNDGAAGAGPSWLQSATLISNHAPPELLDALELLERDGVAVRHIGMDNDWGLVRPGDIAGTDAVISIGKSVPYAIAQGTPVYMYDHFGGDGWLTRDNANASLAHNFSGRPTRRRLDGATIARELVQGYATAKQEVVRLREVIDLRLLSLDHHLSALRSRALRRSASWPAWKLRRFLASPSFRVHLETSRAKSSVMRRTYICAKAIS